MYVPGLYRDYRGWLWVEFYPEPGNRMHRAAEARLLFGGRYLGSNKVAYTDRGEAGRWEAFVQEVRNESETTT